MDDFFKAVFPWIAMGIALAVLAANHADAKKKKTQGSKGESHDHYLSEGMCLGMCAGVVLGTTNVCDLGTGISLGLLLGMIIGLCVKKTSVKQDQHEQEAEEYNQHVQERFDELYNKPDEDEKKS